MEHRCLKRSHKWSLPIYCISMNEPQRKCRKNGIIHYDDEHIHIFILQSIRQTRCHNLDAPPKSVWWNRRQYERRILRPPFLCPNASRCVVVGKGKQELHPILWNVKRIFFFFPSQLFSVELIWGGGKCCCMKGGEADAEFKHVE